MKFHVIGLPHTQTTKEYNACAYTQKVYKFCQMMTERGHEVYHYGVEGSNPPSTENVQILSLKEQEKYFGKQDWKKDFFYDIWDAKADWWAVMNNRAIVEILQRIENRDFVCLIGGVCQKPIADSVTHWARAVEYGIGYHGVFGNYRVFESYAWQHFIYGETKQENGQNYDAVIPNYFDPADFPIAPSRGDYYLYLGRMVGRKGIETASETVKQIGGKLLLAGQGVLKVEGNKIITKEFTLEGPHLEYVGYADTKRRAELMTNAKAVFVPTNYVEPFGGVAVEAQFCGTPAITTDWGAFTETVIHGVTGYRCRTLEQFIWAAENADKLDPVKIREIAVANYSIKKVGEMYEEYFGMLSELWGKGWYTLKYRPQLNWLNKKYG